MRLVKFDFTVKYGGTFHAPCVPFEVEDNDVDELVKIGAKVLPQKPEEEGKVPEEERKEPTAGKKVPYKIPPAEKGK